MDVTETTLGIERPRPVLRLWADIERDIASSDTQSPVYLPSPVYPPASPDSLSAQLARADRKRNCSTDEHGGSALQHVRKRPKTTLEVDCEAANDSAVVFERAVTVEEAIKRRYEHAERTGSVIEAI